jgi:hypothetical protein
MMSNFQDWLLLFSEILMNHYDIIVLYLFVYVAYKMRVALNSHGNTNSYQEPHRTLE